MTNATDWTPAIAILAAGVILGFLFVFISKRKKNAPAEEQPEAIPFFTRHPALKGFFWGIATTAVVGALAYFGYVSSRPREGAVAPVAVATSSAPVSNEIQQLEQAVQSDPENIEKRIALVKAHFGADNLMAVYEQTNVVLEKHPDEPRALTYNAVVRMAMGQLDDARSMLERATKKDPTQLDAWVALASVHMQSGDKKAANAAIETAIKQHPSEEARLRDVLAKLESKPEPQQPVEVAQSNNLPPDHPPLSNFASPEGPIHITLDAPAAAKGGVVYVIAREDGPAANGQHPVAVKRVQTDSFPVSIELGPSDAMMGQSFPSKVNVEARLDADGDAGTSDAAEPKALAKSVAAGTSITLTLK